MSQPYIISFQEGEEGAEWYALNDEVMGGLSEGTFKLTSNHTGLLKGVISLQNSGGFSSVRSPKKAYSFEGKRGAVLRVRGDGRTYRFSVKNTLEVRRASFDFYFDTKPGEWIEVDIPFAKMHPSAIAKEHPELMPLNPGDIQQLFVMLYDEQAGPFEIELDWIKIY